MKSAPANLAGVRRIQAWFSAFASLRQLCVGLVAPGMLPQFWACWKAFFADFAAKWNLSIMVLHMLLQRVAAAKLFGADEARKCLLLLVGLLVGHHVPLLAEAFATKVAAKGFFSRVQPHVRLLRSNRGELFATEAAGSAAVAVNLKMLSQIVTGVQTFAAHATQTLSLLRVFLHMFD